MTECYWRWDLLRGKISLEAYLHTCTCTYTHRKGLLKKARCTLDRLLKAPVSSLMAAEFPLTTQSCSTQGYFTHTGDRRTATASMRLLFRPRVACRHSYRCKSQTDFTLLFNCDDCTHNCNDCSHYFYNIYHLVHLIHSLKRKCHNKVTMVTIAY